jgi:hypothetical protein
MKPHKACSFRFTESIWRGEKSKKRDAESKGKGKMQRAEGRG